MRDGWELTPLGDVLEPVRRPVSVETLSEVRFAGVRWYAEGAYERATESASAVKTKTLYEVKNGDVIYNRMWATKASFGVAGPDVDGCLVTNDFPTFLPIGTSAAYVRLIFQWRPFQATAAASALGTTERRRLHERDFAKISVPLPPLDEQRRIVDLIGALDDTIEAEMAVLELLRALRPRFLTQAFGEGDQTSVSALISRIEAGKSPKADGRPPNDGEEGVLKVSAVHPWGFRPTESKVLDPEYTGFQDSHRVRGGDVLITRANTADLVGVSCLVEEDHPNLYICDKTLRLVPADCVEPDALVAALNSPEVRRQISDKGTGSSASMKNITQADIRSIQLTWPSDRSEQGRIGATDRAFLESARRVSDSLTRLRSLRSNLLTALLSGEHEIPSSYDEVAEELAA